MSDELAAGPPRYPLGLPAGSVRSILSLMVVGMICTLVVVSTTTGHVRPIPPYLIYLLFLILGSIFAAQGASMNRRAAGEKPSLYLPRWTVHIVIIAALIATVIWKLTNDPEGWHEQVRVTVERIKEVRNLYMPLYVLGGFFLGVLARLTFGRTTSVIYQDLIAWVSLLAIVGMTADILITLVIVPSLRTDSDIDFPTFEGILAGIIAFYFAARS